MRVDKDIVNYLNDNKVTKDIHKFAALYKTKKSAMLAAELLGTARFDSQIYLRGCSAVINFVETPS